MPPEVTSKHIGTATELTCLFPIKSGFIPTLDTRTYSTRLRVVFKVLNELRVASREVRDVKPIVDIVDMARTVHTFTWAVVNERQLLLNVVFDRPWEPYIRVIWKDLGPLLDLFICNCEGFVTSNEPFERFADFVRRHQVNVDFFYPASSLSIDDQRYLVALEKGQRVQGPAVFPPLVCDPEPKNFERDAATLVMDDPTVTAANARRDNPAETLVQWLTVLRVLYGLRSMFPEGTDDHQYLHAAANALLQSSRPTFPPGTESPELDWLDTPVNQYQKIARRRLEDTRIQGGIVTHYERVTHGCLLLARIVDPDAARAFIRDALLPGVSHEGGAPVDDVYTNVALTFNGLRKLGARESDLARFPKEFREGMEARAGLLGDLRGNHPEYWALPEWNINPPGDTPGRPTPRVRMSSVDLVIVLRKREAWDAPHDWLQHPLHDHVETLAAEAAAGGIAVLSRQPLSVFRDEDGPGAKRWSRDHFGFQDGISQPGVPEHRTEKNMPVETGELVIGYQNDRDDPAFPAPDEVGEGTPPIFVQGSLIDNGSFLVVRKLRQHVQRLWSAVDPAASKAGLHRDELLAKMMGRTLDGAPLGVFREAGPGGDPPALDPQRIPPRGEADDDNRFTFTDDPAGSGCPFHAHIRRASSRATATASTGRPLVLPTIARRGMAYGPRFVDGASSDNEDRGLMFMAYNASIAEQFEVIQRWMAGGNTPTDDHATGVYGGQPDPFLGLPDPGERRTYRFLHTAGDGADERQQVHRVDLGDKPFVTLQWGLYLFTPSIPALAALSALEPAGDPVTGAATVAFGTQVMARLKTLNDWAAVLEDVLAAQSGATAAVYAAIRATQGGVMRTPYGVLVASRDLGMEVLSKDSLFSVSEYQRRFGRSIGKGYLGMDSGDDYLAQSGGPNTALEAITEETAFTTACAVTKAVFEAAITKSQALQGPPTRPAPVPLKPVMEAVLARLAKAWFDIPDGTHLVAGDLPGGNEDPPRCPFHFLAPSRYVFSSPNPREEVIALGEGHGRRILEAVRTFVREHRHPVEDPPPALEGPVSQQLFATIDDDDLLARVLLGLVFGFVPTVHGNALSVLAQWLGDESLWRVQQNLLAAPGDTYARATMALRPPLELAMQKSAVPPLLHRTVTTPCRLGGVDLNTGDRVVLAVAGMAQDGLAHGQPDVTTVFGGNRKGEEAPTHACPGYDIAMGVLLGFFAGILDSHALAPTPSQFTVRVL